MLYFSSPSHTNFSKGCSMLSISPLSSLTPRFILPLPCHQNYFLPRSLVTSTLLNPMDSLHTSDLISHFLPLMMLYSFFFKLKKLFYMYLIGRWLQYCNVFAIPQHELATGIQLFILTIDYWNCLDWGKSLVYNFDLYLTCVLKWKNGKVTVQFLYF